MMVSYTHTHTNALIKYSQTDFSINIVAIFKPQALPALHTLNRMLQTSLQQQLSKTGNVNDAMCDFIDGNKYLLSDNRTPFIQHDSKATIFEIEHSHLPFANWVQNAHHKFSKASNVYMPFQILEKTRRAAKRKDSTNPENFDLNTPVTSAKRRRIAECESMFDDVKNNLYLQTNERLLAITAIKNSTFVEEVTELYREFSMADGEQLLDRLSDEQRDCLNNILQYAYPGDFNILKCKKEEYSSFFKIFVIEGSAGCGKSSIIESLNFYTYKNHSKYTNMLYITQTNVLCQSMYKKCKYNSKMQYMTFFKFLSILELNYYDKKTFLLACDSMKIDAFQHTCGDDFIKEVKSSINLPPISEETDDDDNGNIEYKKARLFVVFDEVYTLSSGRLSLFLFLVRCIKQQHPNISIYCILIGDKHQLRPFTKLEDIKIQVVKDDEEHAFDIKKETKDEAAATEEEKKLDLALLSEISQSESIPNATRFFLTRQFRIADNIYHDYVNRVRNAENRTDIGVQLLNDIQTLWADKINQTLSVVYPLDDILDALGDDKSFTDYRKIVIEFSHRGIFDKSLDTTVFCFTNQHAHYYNLALAFSYWNQIEDKAGPNPNDFVTFSLCFHADTTIGDLEKRNIQIATLINKRNYLVNTLPLIRYCPYKILTSNCPVARLSVVYLLDWILNAKKEITNLIVFSADKNIIFSLLPSRFEMNLFKNTKLFGFPLQFAFSSTFASSQGLTLNNKIAISCSNISKAELYVCLTRIKNSKDLVRIF